MSSHETMTLHLQLTRQMRYALLAALDDPHHLVAKRRDTARALVTRALAEWTPPPVRARLTPLGVQAAEKLRISLSPH